MIDCLSNPAWISPQVDFLVMLQNIRIGYLEIFDKFFLSVTIFGEFWLPTLVCAIVYWCIDFRAGIYLFSLQTVNSIFAHFFKMIAGVYRPWVLSDKIKPSELAVSFAKGYSYPSGHSAMSSSVFGGLAYLLRHKIFSCILLISLVLLIGFSRMWLGVHTPQDVISGFAIGLILIFAIDKILNWAELNPNRYLILAIVTDILTVLMLLYMFNFDDYRMDYFNGELLVDPISFANSTIKIYGYLLGLINGCFLCRRFFPFNPKNVSVKNRVIIGLIGGIFIATILRLSIINIFIMNKLPVYCGFACLFLTGLFVTLIYPLIFCRIDKNFRSL